MHELLLHASIPRSRHTQLLNIFAGISAMQPAPVLEKHLVFKPNATGQGDAKGAAAGKTGMQTVEQKKLHETAKGDLFYLQVVGEGKVS